MKIGSFRFDLRELAGSMGVFGTLLPLAIGYITVCKMNPAGLLIMMGLANIATGVKGLGVLALYVLPIFTVPLLPIGLLWVSGSGEKKSFSLVGAFKTMWRHPKDFVVLWLWLMVWSSAMALVIVAAIVLFGLTDMIPSVEGYSQTLLKTIITAVEVMIIGAVCCVFGLALFRCIGQFARHNAGVSSVAAVDSDRSKPMTGGGN